MRVLFIMTNDISQSFGGAILTRRNYDMLCSLYGAQNISVVLLKEFPSETIFQKVRKTIIKYLKASQFDFSPLMRYDFSKYDIIFNDNSVLGSFLIYLKKIKFRGKIISHFHNCEKALYHQIYLKKPWYIRFALYRIVSLNEMATLRYSDICIILNQRDYCEIKKNYSNIFFKFSIIPVSMKDNYNTDKLVISSNTPPLYTFVGSYFAPNVTGICWFIDNVLPFVDIKLRIIGKNMDKLTDHIEMNHKVELLSNIDNIDKYIYESDCMIYPIFEGSGMKLKTCEALMFGKNIIGTPEAFAGYDIDDYSLIGGCCDNANDFIRVINNFSKPKFNEASRLLYLNHYSYDSSLASFKHLICNL